MFLHDRFSLRKENVPDCGSHDNIGIQSQVTPPTLRASRTRVPQAHFVWVHVRDPEKRKAAMKVVEKRIAENN